MFYGDEDLFEEVMNPIYRAQKKTGIVSNYNEYVELAKRPISKELADCLDKISKEIKENGWEEIESRYTKPIYYNTNGY